ncbi:MAG: transcription antitermination factor NusB [Rickettsiaceae bacterium]|nr:transcription antitermination factor NusB [Rickettsiaceae bacterium]
MEDDQIHLNINTKTISRIAAIQAIYLASIYKVLDDRAYYTKITDNIEELYSSGEFDDEFVQKNSNIKPKLKINKKLFRQICEEAILEISIIDDLISTSLSANNKFENFHESMKSILRCASAELILRSKTIIAAKEGDTEETLDQKTKSTPLKVILNEYTTIASELIYDHEVGFINSVLEKINYQIEENAAKVHKA